ncbi:MAG: hypothetical protein WB709_05830 [Solirubrobacteraceae bacterium]
MSTLNAAKFAGEAPVAVYAELSRERIQVFVRESRRRLRSRDRAPGQTWCAGVDHRQDAPRGGRAQVRSLPGGGTEVEITVDRGGRR